MRNMAFSMTTPQARAKTKTVTRRQGWGKIKPGQLIQQIVKGMGLKKGEKVERIHVIRILSTRWEPVNAITQEDVIKEGFPGMTPEDFTEFYCAGNRITPDELCNRIEFEYVEGQP